jgi:asparagine synthetase B (glutamine-hydrolysing)
VKQWGGYNGGVLEDTLTSEEEARERAGRQRVANRTDDASTACTHTPCIGAKAHGRLRGILHNPVSSEFKDGASVVYLGQGGDEIHMGYVVAVLADGEGGAP